MLYKPADSSLALVIFGYPMSIVMYGCGLSKGKTNTNEELHQVSTAR